MNECDNCGAVLQDEELAEILDYFERVEPGGTVPSGECPNCHALCYPIWEEAKGCPIAAHHPSCDCQGEGGDR